jgi:uncharacterized protein YebE (UPF0316 family)
VGSIWNVLAIQVFAASTLVGMTIEEHLARLTGCGSSADLNKNMAEMLRQAGFGVTEMSGQGMRGSVEVFEVVVRRADLPKALQTIDHVDAKAFVTVEETRRVYRGWRLSK